MANVADDNEEWRACPEFETFYQISNYGTVRSVHRLVHKTNGRHAIFKAQVLRPSMGSGYKRVVLSKEGFKRTLSIHRLIAVAFIPNPQRAREINHINGIKTDNRIENLEWCSRSENALHASKIGLMVSPLRGRKGEKHPSSKLKNPQVVEIKKMLANGVTQIEIAQKYSVSDKAVSDIKIGRTWQHIHII